MFKKWNAIFRGAVIDIGPGNDPLCPPDWTGITSLDLFDKEQGDANKIDEYFPADHFDCVHGSQVLEHLHDPIEALHRMLKITKPGGHVIMTVPDFDLYEQGVFPSRWNSDHKSTWSLWHRKLPNGSPLHVFVPALRPLLRQIGATVTARLCADNYDWMVMHVDQTINPADGVEAFIEIEIKKNL